MIATYLEDFGPAAFPPESDTDGESVEEEQRLAIFEQGYSAGWEDAIAAQAKNTHVASETFAKNLSDLSFTYQEAVQNVTAALVPFLQALADTLVPDALEAGLAQRIATDLAQAVDVENAAEVTVRCSPARHPLISVAVPAALEMPVKIVADPALPTDAVSLTFATSERHIDLSELTAHIRQSIEAFAFQLNKDLSHG